MNDEQLMRSIAAQAPHLKPNDTVFVSRDLWWTVVSEERLSEDHMVVTSGPPADTMQKIRTIASGPAADGLLWYGTGLSVWSLIANGLLMILLVNGLIRGRVDVMDVPHRCLLLNHVTIQTLTTVLVVPLTMAVETLEGGWPWGGTACRAWLLGRLLLAGANFWSMLSVVFDRFLSVAASSAYRYLDLHRLTAKPRYSTT